MRTGIITTYFVPNFFFIKEKFAIFAQYNAHGKHQPMNVVGVPFINIDNFSTLR
ncbi:hypothetical protein HMPREF3226_02220 [Prevotella corporis]|uniref:Uncharacterized protein n=1 Tax=Prevotella corporis TaxID=28128 RepID=A0A133PXN0_9BACT|nr:hypothetical protein HMPREF3226_02220 [Prevotella corporis]